MKKGKVILMALALSGATALYAGNGMGETPCDAKGSKGMQCGTDMGQGMMKGQGPGMMQGKQGKMHAKDMRKRPNRMQRMMQRMQKQLDLTPEQQQKIQAIMSDYWQQMQSQMHKKRGQGMGQGMGKGMQARGMKGQGRGMGMQGQGKGMKRRMPLASVLGAEQFDKAAFVKMMEQRWAKKDARRMEHRRVMLEHLSAAMEKVHDVLTPEQRKKLLELSQQKAR